ncbi:MAG: hypothetical protein V1870_02535 [Candidatus Aenigmatarchaeota archaeon]
MEYVAWYSDAETGKNPRIVYLQKDIQLKGNIKQSYPFREGVLEKIHSEDLAKFKQFCEKYFESIESKISLSDMFLFADNSSVDIASLKPSQETQYIKIDVHGHGKKNTINSVFDTLERTFKEYDLLLIYDCFRARPYMKDEKPHTEVTGLVQPFMKICAKN